MSDGSSKCGKCWSCTYSEGCYQKGDHHNAPYYRNCTKTGQPYQDKCRFTCGDYVWDGKTVENERYSNRPTKFGYSKGGFVYTLIVIIIALILATSYFSKNKAEDEPAPEVTSSEAPAPDILATVNTPRSDLNVRQEPTTAAGIVIKIPKGETVKVLEQGEEWSKIEYNGSVGWSVNKYLIIQEVTTEE